MWILMYWGRCLRPSYKSYKDYLDYERCLSKGDPINGANECINIYYTSVLVKLPVKSGHILCECSCKVASQKRSSYSRLRNSLCLIIYPFLPIAITLWETQLIS